MHYTKIIRYSFFSLVLGLFLITSLHSSFSQSDERLNELSEEDFRLIEEYLDQAEYLFEQRFTEGTIHNYDKVLEIDPLNIDALNGKAVVLDFIGKHEEAISYYDMVLSIDPDNDDALQGLFLAFENLENPDDLISSFDEDLETEALQELLEEISDNSIESLRESFEQAEDLLEEENFEEAISYYDKVLAIDSSDIDALNGKALALASLGDYEETISYYDKVLAIDSSDMNALNGKALALSSLDNHEEAISFYDKALEIDPSDIDALFGKALSLESLGRDEESLLNLEKVETLIPPEIEFREPGEPQNKDVVEEIAESEKIIFVIVGIFIIIILIIIALDFFAKRKKSLPSAET